MTRQTQLWAALLCLSLTIALVAGWRWNGSPDQEFRRGQTALARGDWATVSRQIERLRQSPAHANEVRLLRGGLLLRTGDPRGAIVELSRVLADGEQHEQALLLLCEAQYQLKRWLEAAHTALELLRVHPDHPEAHRWLGAIYFDLGAYLQAESHLKELARLMPTDYKPHRLLGLIHKDFERYKESIGDYQQALQLQPPAQTEREIRLELAQAQIKQNDYEAALETLNYPWPPGSVEHHTLAVECLWSINQKEEAKQRLRQAQAAAPDDPNVLFQVARIALDEGRIQDALPPLQMLVDADPFNHQRLFDLAAVHRRLGHEADADRFLERSNAARELMKQLAELNQRVLDEPDNVELRHQLASVCDQLGKKELAATWRDAAAAMLPTSKP